MDHLDFQSQNMEYEQSKETQQQQQQTYLNYGSHSFSNDIYCPSLYSYFPNDYMNRSFMPTYPSLMSYNYQGYYTNISNQFHIKYDNNKYDNSLSLYKNDYSSNALRMNFYESYNLHNRRKKKCNFVLPSGPRRDGEGIEMKIQGILNNIELHDKCVMEITLLVAGFIIGPGGITIRDIQLKSGSEIQSWTQTRSPNNPSKIRIFVIKGNKQSIEIASKIITSGVNRYKMLSEGKFHGKHVNAEQEICGVIFHYSPPPKSANSLAAGLFFKNDNENEKFYNI